MAGSLANGQKDYLLGEPEDGGHHPAVLKERVLTYMKYKCGNSGLKEVKQAAFRLNCSARQLQRILHQYEAEGMVRKLGKGAYQLNQQRWEPSE